MSKVGDTLMEGTRAMAGIFGMENTVPKSGARKRKEAAAAMKARRQSTQFVVDDGVLGVARRRAGEQQRARSGRLSTILSDSELLGG